MKKKTIALLATILIISVTIYQGNSSVTAFYADAIDDVSGGNNPHIDIANVTTSENTIEIRFKGTVNPNATGSEYTLWLDTNDDGNLDGNSDWFLRLNVRTRT